MCVAFQAPKDADVREVLQMDLAHEGRKLQGPVKGPVWLSHDPVFPITLAHKNPRVGDSLPTLHLLPNHPLLSPSTLL